MCIRDRVYANDFIAVHLQEIGGGKTYAQLSAMSLADPSNKALAAKVELMFKGTTLRAMLLEAYAFSMFGTIAVIGGIVAMILGGILFLMTIAGWVHYRKVPETQQFPAKTAVRSRDRELVNA